MRGREKKKVLNLHAGEKVKVGQARHDVQRACEEGIEPPLALGAQET